MLGTVKGYNSLGTISLSTKNICPLQENKYANFPKNEHFVLPDTHTLVCVSGGKKCAFFWKACFIKKMFRCEDLCQHLPGDIQLTNFWFRKPLDLFILYKMWSYSLKHGYLLIYIFLLNVLPTFHPCAPSTNQLVECFFRKIEETFKHPPSLSWSSLG